MDEKYRLGQRDGMPPYLLFLRDKHPRGTWRGRPALKGTGEFWLANHDRFRSLTDRIGGTLTHLREKGETAADSAATLRRDLGNLLGSLDGHHRVEDESYFPAFGQAEPRLLAAFRILDDDHLLIHDRIDALTTTAQESLRQLGQAEGVMTGAEKRAVDALAAEMARFAPALRQHLMDEEDVVIPLILDRVRDDPEFR